ncbi:IgGFc-binding protein [Myxococcota bacterium]|nr:IgGFc-binding protein [Myxococcota bacterium]MBU1412179.1 IgGFc-binding protein [Myxococcota bacterium]MBU1508827.1 IgGFc-binding protein [Myxococcota bacterium]
MFRLSLFLNVIVVMVLASCTPSKKKEPCFDCNNINNNINNVNVCTTGQKQCFGNTLQVCSDNQWINDQICTDPTRVCDPVNLRCQTCVSNGTTCGSDNAVHVCNADGTVGLVQTSCDSLNGEQCVEVNGVAACDSPCIRASSTKSYRGCEYWALGMASGQLDSAFDGNFGLAIDNANDSPVRVQITGGGANVDQQIPANTLQVIFVNYQNDIRMASSADGLSGLQSGIYRSAESKGAYHVQTSLPVTVYQFSPYDFELGGTNSYSNDASLLLPATVLSGNYMVMSRPTMVLSNGFNDMNSPGVMAVVATADNTQVTVNSKAYFAAGPSVGALTPGGTMQYALNKGDVLQLVSKNDLTYSGCPTGAGSAKSGPDSNSYYYCKPGNDYDPTGSMITATNPVAVWSGHNCTFIPYNFWACDHLEEMMFPLQTWGKHFMVGLTHPVRPSTTETNVIRILAGENGVQVSFNPAVENPATLNAGEYVEFMPPPGTHFEVNATGPIMIGKFTVGQNYWTESFDEMGDPAFGLVVPVEQYRSDYTFSTPPSITVNYVNVIAEIPADTMDYITLDGQAITAEQYTPIGSTGYGVAQFDVTSTGTNGSHYIVAPNTTIKFGIEVYGFAQYTSYLYPGGLDLEYINPIGK